MYIPRAILPALTAVTISGNIIYGQMPDFNLRHINITTIDSVIKATALYDTNKQKPQPECDYYWFDAGKINHNIGGFTGKLLHGKYEVFDNQQKLKVTGFFEYGVMTGSWTRWYPNGNIQFTGFYKKGVLHGEYKTFTPDGKPVSTLNYKKGLLQGKSYFFQPDTTIVRKYKTGKEVIAEDKSARKIEAKKNPDQQMKTSSSQQNRQKTEVQPKKPWWKLSFLKRSQKKKSDTQINPGKTQQDQKTSAEKTKQPWWKFSFLKRKKTKNDVKN